MANLYFFDIDGTLVNLTRVHAKAYMTAYQKVLGKEAEGIKKEEIIATFGMAERAQHKQIFEKHNLSDEGRIAGIIKIYEKLFLDALNLVEVKPLPGAVNFLDYLKKQGDHIGIIHGGPKYKGEIILKKAGLHNYFSLFGYDEGFNERKEILRNIVKKAREKGYRFKKIVVIGDTREDIRAGKAEKAITVAVATGTETKEKLKMGKPDIIVSTLKQYPEILKKV